MRRYLPARRSRATIAAAVPKNVVAPMVLRIKRGPDGGILHAVAKQRRSLPQWRGHFRRRRAHGNGQDLPAARRRGQLRDGCQDRRRRSAYGLIGSIARSALGLRLGRRRPCWSKRRLANFDFEKARRRPLSSARPAPSSAASSEIRAPVQILSVIDDKTLTIARGRHVRTCRKNATRWKDAPRDGFVSDDSLDVASLSRVYRARMVRATQDVVIDTPSWADKGVNRRATMKKRAHRRHQCGI